MQLLNHLFITKNQLLASDIKPESEFESNQSDSRVGMKPHQTNSSKPNIEKPDPVEVAQTAKNYPASTDAIKLPPRKTSDWLKNANETRKKDQPFEKTAQKDQAEKQTAPNPKKKIQITEQNAEKDTITAEILETEKKKLSPKVPRVDPIDQDGKQNSTKFKNTPLDLNGVVNNLRAWRLPEVPIDPSAEQNLHFRSNHLIQKDEIPEEPEQADLKSNYQGMEQNELGGSGDQSGMVSVYNYDRIQEAEAAQKKLLEEMMMDLAIQQPETSALQNQHTSAHQKLTVSEIEEEQKKLLEELCLDEAERLPTIISAQELPEKQAQDLLVDIEAEQMKLLEEMMEPALPISSKKQSTDEKYLVDQPRGIIPPSPREKHNQDNAECNFRLLQFW